MHVPNISPPIKIILAKPPPQVRTLHDVDISQLKTKPFNGAALEPAWEPPSAPHTPKDNDGEKTYLGSCQCKAVTFSVKSPEIKEVTECNCSICSRVCISHTIPQIQRPLPLPFPLPLPSTQIPNSADNRLNKTPIATTRTATFGSTPHQPPSQFMAKAKNS